MCIRDRFQNKGPDACAIHAPEDGSGLTLQFIGEYRPHTELPNLWGLHGIELKDFDLTGLAAVHPHLKELRLWGAPGNLGNFSAVEGFRELTNLSTFDPVSYTHLLKLKRFGSLVDSEMNQQVFIMDLSFNPEITDELMVVYFDLNKEIFCITHES